MGNRVALIGIIVEKDTETGTLNRLLHEYREWIVGRMGIPYRERDISIISVAVDAPSDVISALSGKLGMIRGVTTKTIYSKLPEAEK